ncbi:MAG TPA: hypothetical protein VKV15_05345 [Bryobacteraceae bacterium]|nr:hypothetical protein [Bryobacteraceae bacterium]
MSQWKSYVLASFCAIAAGQARAQAPQFAVLNIEFENAVTYIDDIGDPNKFASSPVPLTLGPTKSFTPFVVIGDIASVNGIAVKGTFVDRGRGVFLMATPNPGQAIGDFLRGGAVDIYLEIRRTDLTAVGTIMTSGFTGGAAPPGSPVGAALNLAVTGGTGAYLGAKGMVISSDLSFRNASIQEDPSKRRINGGNRGHFVVYLIPLAWPQIVTIANGPAVVHSSDGSLVTAAKPAKSGEVLTLYATGLGPTVPALAPGAVFSASPLQTVNSPIDITVGGQAADVLYAGGYPGSTDGFQVNFRVPSGITAGTKTLQIAAAFISSPEVNIAIQ